MQPSGRRAYELVQPVLDVHVQVFQGGVPGEITGLDLFPDPAKALDDQARVFSTDDALPGQHSGMHDGTRDVLLVEPLVVVNGYRVLAVIVHGGHISENHWDFPEFSAQRVQSQP